MRSCRSREALYRDWSLRGLASSRSHRVRKCDTSARLSKAFALSLEITYSGAGSEECRFFCVEEWRRRVEIIGNLYYPQDLALKGISGDLLLDAAIDRKGKIKSIRILRTSGSSVLDNAAINIVKLASPFSPLPEKIIEETDILHITRTWKFSNKGSNLK